ncbi:MAG: molybdate ABC transporter substrate-binding protein [Planctomycetota bacterium]|nr:molybdate ABC transporter substrate-binding protein [Planctomycetota bacterium]
MDQGRANSGTAARWLLAVLALAVLCVCGALLLRSGTGNRPTLLLYCAAGCQPPVKEVIADYEKESGVSIGVQYGGSGQLLSNIEAVRRGDLFLAGDNSYIAIGRQKGLIAEAIPLALMRPVILVAKGNPKGIRTVADLLAADTRVALANPDQAAIGRAVRELLRNTGQWDAMEKHAAVFKPTVNDLANDVKVGSADAAIVWDATARQYPQLDMVRVDVLDRATEQVTIGVLTASAQPTAALRFARYLGASDRGLQAFRKHGYEPVAAEPWAGAGGEGQAK